jgi:hypothetical protein
MRDFMEKPEIRSPKPEGRFRFRISVFGFLSAFGIRHSDFIPVACRMILELEAAL